VKAVDDAKKKIAEADKKRGDRTLTTGELRQRATDLGTDLETRRANAQKLIRAGCIVTPGTDSYWAAAPELSREPKPENQDHGMGTIMAIEGLVELGMTPAQAITAGTKNGAVACKRAADFGTIEAGKLADLVLLDGDPLADIHNIRKVRAVFKEGRKVEIEALPSMKVFM
jgi:imidazolonepropionase-like amidohydrolase